MEGLSPTDAIVMPVLAGTTLAGLYFLIKWLQNPALLNKILNGYFALFAVFSVSRLITDSLDIGHSIIFPRRYALGGALYHVHGKDKKATPVAGSIKDKKDIETCVVDTPIINPEDGVRLADGTIISRDILKSGFKRAAVYSSALTAIVTIIGRLLYP